MLQLNSHDWVAFALLSALLLWVSRKPLRRPGSHGFYRYFAWQTMLVLIFLNRPEWGEHPETLHQQIATVLQVSSLLLLLAALSGLVPAYGGKRRVDTTLYEFEKTARLVSSGVFRYIRHPMYASLLALTWAVFCQDPSWAGLTLALIATAFLVRTTLADEAECLAYFGEEYRRYMQHTRRYLPFLL
ncbi:methyltransferase family protein [Azonexus sp.]|uniref:methyltransferase family protein n=1 Tax=Azonexus sp. TaxID=1872668 RepID=UPI0039E49552